MKCIGLRLHSEDDSDCHLWRVREAKESNGAFSLSAADALYVDGGEIVMCNCSMDTCIYICTASIQC